MLQSAFYDHPTHHIRLVQTHISWVVLTGDYAYKIKKPVDFGFLDFSTLEKRQAMCRKELELNRRLAPELYLAVLPICKSSGRFRLGTGNHDTKAVEYCLKMAQFDPEALLAREIDEEHFDSLWMDALALQIADFHAAAEVAGGTRFGSAAVLRHYIDENLEAARRLAQMPGMPDRHAELQRGASRMLTRLEPQLAARIRDGHIRACHGDLHLGNIALVKGRPRIFDCIEFNDELRLIDTMNDAAFLTMDCEARGHPELGRRFVSRYLEHTGDYEGLALLPLYQFYRAGVRGKVALLLSEDTGLSADAAAAKRREADTYFRLAAAYAAPVPAPRLMAVGGLSGSGKSHLALLGLAAEGALVIRSDATRKRLAAGTVPLYTPAMTEATYAAMLRGADAALAAGFSVILDATFLDPAHRDQARRLAEGRGVPFSLLWLDVPAPELRRRVCARAAAGSDVSDADLAVLEAQLSAYRRPEEKDIRFLQASDRWPEN
jgi:hypothetical protein